MNKKSLQLKQLEKCLKGDLFSDYTSRVLYATDASAYREIPLAVARPENTEDICKLIQFAGDNAVTLIPRAAGTSLAGQVVGNGIVVDMSKYFTSIVDINTDEHYVDLQPGVVLDELNLQLLRHGLFFGPETSTSNRCTIGGMIGNNACGAHSLIYGSTRDHLLAAEAVLSNGAIVSFNDINKETFIKKQQGSSLENKLYSHMAGMFSSNDICEGIIREFPDREIRRRNTGYALDLLMDSEVFGNGNLPFNFSKLLAGSEGTLAFITKARLNLVPLPPVNKALICIHFETLEDALLANLICLNYHPGAVELMDRTILECTRSNIEQRKNRFFIEGDPGAVLIVEFARSTMDEIAGIRSDLVGELKKAGLGYHFPLISGNDINKVWALRKSGLGVLSNLPGDAKPVSLVEDTAVHPRKLPDFIKEFKSILHGYNLSCVFHAHVGTGELHLRPVINLKTKEGITLFRQVAKDVALLVKKYNGSLSGEHGDGRLRGEFIPLMVGEKNYELMRGVKRTWDPEGIFNKGKIIDVPAMDSFLRYSPNDNIREMPVIFDYSASGGFLSSIEQCNGSGDCRKSVLMGGTMCPSYMATRNEQTTTRARANALREYMTNPQKKEKIAINDVYDILDLCLSCKGCKSECPSSVDMAKLKAEFLQHYHDIRGIPLRSRLIANIGRIHSSASRIPGLYNFAVSTPVVKDILKLIMNFSNKRELPKLSPVTLEKWFTHKYDKVEENERFEFRQKKEILLFMDEFTNHTDAEVGIAAIKLLRQLGYRVHITPAMESGRTYISKGLLKKARNIANHNVSALHKQINGKLILIGLEPSAILTFRDEYPELVDDNLRSTAVTLASGCFTLDEFIAGEYDEGNISRDLFTSESRKVLYHGHCQQKAIASTRSVLTMLSIPRYYSVEEIKSGCCGMAGAFGYERNHYDLSMKIGEMVLFPSVRKSDTDTIICASGTSCRQQIIHGTHRIALHPAEVLYQAMV